MVTDVEIVGRHASLRPEPRLAQSSRSAQSTFPELVVGTVMLTRRPEEHLDEARGSLRHTAVFWV